MAITDKRRSKLAKVKQVNIYLDENEYFAVKDTASHHGVSISRYIWSLIKNDLKNRPRIWDFVDLNESED